jgi:hypothetical protein
MGPDTGRPSRAPRSSPTDGTGPAFADARRGAGLGGGKQVLTSHASEEGSVVLDGCRSGDAKVRPLSDGAPAIAVIAVIGLRIAGRRRVLNRPSLDMLNRSR